MAGGFGIETRGSGGPEYPGKMTLYVKLACIAAAMGGLIFGYDNGISGGVTSMDPFLKRFFRSVYHQEAVDQSTNQYCKFNSVTLTMFTSSLFLAATVSSFFASWLTRRMGRKYSMMLGGLLFFSGGVINGSAVHVAMLIVGRILLGLGLGCSIQSVPLYVSEMAPYKHRGSLNVVFQLSITIGILVANIINYFTAQIHGGWGWRVSLAGACVPALFIFVSAICLSDTPNSMLERGQDKEAREKLRQIRGVTNNEVEQEFSDLKAASEASKQVKHPWRNLLERKYRPHLVLCIVIPALQQLTGINVVMFYAPVLFRTIGFGSNSSLISAAVTGAVNVFSTFISVYGVDKWGRRPLFFWGGGLMIVFQLAVAVLIGWKFGVSGVVSSLPTWYALLVVFCICVFVASYAFSWGPLGWLVPSEILPLEIRSAAYSIVVSTNMLFTFAVAQLFLPLLCALKFGLFILFAVFLVIMTAVIYFLLPETMNIPIEHMWHIWEEHPFWRKYVESAPRGCGDEV